ncbi:hypothetical protein ACR30L_13140 [Psychromonas sp. PT13]|uniref:hypothetical protein n=1 Tax=Psychromonas sp. PT13 TaxID=3439547 RepID=UPI003EBE4A1B
MCLALKWIFGVFFVLLGLLLMVKTRLGGGALILISLLLLPPISHFIGRKFNKVVSIKIVVLLIITVIIINLSVLVSQVKDEKARERAHLEWQRKAIEAEAIKRGKIKDLQKSNPSSIDDAADLVQQNNPHDQIDIKSATLGDKNISLSTLNTVVSFTNDISLNWDHSVMKKYIAASNFLKNEEAYKNLFSKHSYLGKLKQCKNFASVEIEQSDVFVIKQDCEFENGNAFMQLVFKPKDLESELIGMTMKGEVLSEESITCGILGHKESHYYLKTNTLDIPYVTETESPEFSFGCIIEKSGDFDVHYMIKSSKKIIDNLSELNIHLPTSERKAIETSTFHFSDETHLSITLDNSDVPGPYEINIFIDGRLSKQVTFNVQ